MFSKNMFNTKYGSYEEQAGYVKEAFEEILMLDHNWDGEGSLAPERRTISNTHYVVREFMDNTFPPDVTPVNNGTISLEWQTETGHAHLQIGITKYSMYISSNKVNPTHFFDGKVKDINDDLPKMIQYLNDELFPLAEVS